MRRFRRSGRYALDVVCAVQQRELLLEGDPEIDFCAMRAIIRTAHAMQRRLSVQSVELANYIYSQHARSGVRRAT